VARLYLERGVRRTAVVVGSEAISPLLVPIYQGKDPAAIRMRDRLGLYTFGDGAGAMVLRADIDEASPGRGIYGSAIACVGGGRLPGMQIVGGGTHAPLHEQMKARRLVDLRVDVVASSRFTPHVLTEALADVLRCSGVSAGEIDVCVLPEGNAGYMTDEMRAAGLITSDWLAIQDKIVENLALVGATGSAAVPLALDFGWQTGRIKQGDRVLLLAIETSKWKYAGMVLPWTLAEPLGTHASPIGAAVVA
jgi:3-oxoacyl-[acyl-carrier-protein] synthase-3